jgi:hypothetical protein
VKVYDTDKYGRTVGVVEVKHRQSKPLDAILTKNFRVISRCFTCQLQNGISMMNVGVKTLSEKKIEVIPGANNIILVAPHGHPKNDMNTGELARRLAARLKCHAVINEYYRKPYYDKELKKYFAANKANGFADLNDAADIATAGLVDDFIKPLIAIKNKILASEECDNAYVIHLHGIRDKRIAKMKPEHLAMLIGIGKGDPDRLSAHNDIVREFASSVTNYEDHPMISRIETEGTYSAWDMRRLNQLFTAINKDTQDDRIQSIQLEFKYNGFRDTGNLDKTVETLEYALRKMACT